MQERCEETVSIPEGTEGRLITEVAAMELAENREVEVKQGKDEEERQRCWKEKNHHHHDPHDHHHHHPHHHTLHHLPHRHTHHHLPRCQNHHMKRCGRKMKKGSEGSCNSKFVGKLKHKLEKINWKIESLQEKKLFILRRIQEIEEDEDEKKKKNEGAQNLTGLTPLPTDAA